MKSNDENEVLLIEEDEEIDVLHQLGTEDADPTPKEIFNAIVGLSRSHQKLSNDVNKFRKETSAFLMKHKTNIEKIPEIVEDNKKLEVRVNRLEKCVEMMQQKEKDRNVIINGIPKISTDKLPIMFRKITKIILGCDIDFEYISAMTVKPGSKATPIVVCCSKSKDKALLMKKKREKGDISLEQLGFDVTKVENRKIYISNHLITPVYQLLKEARKMKQHGYQFAWSRGTTVFIQKSESSPKVHFNSLDELEKFKTTLH